METLTLKCINPSQSLGVINEQYWRLGIDKMLDLYDLFSQTFTKSYNSDTPDSDILFDFLEEIEDIMESTGHTSIYTKDWGVITCINQHAESIPTLCFRFGGEEYMVFTASVTELHLNCQTKEN